MKNLKEKLKNIFSDLKDIPEDIKSRKILYFCFAVYVFNTLILMLPELGFFRYTCLLGIFVNNGYIYSYSKYGAEKIKTKKDFISIFTCTASNVAFLVGFFSN